MAFPYLIHQTIIQNFTGFESMTKVYDSVVIGGGLIGMLTARALAKEGDRVAIIDKNEMGKEASWAGGGILSPLYPWRYEKPVTKLARWSQIHYEAFANELFQETGIDPEYIKSGLLIIDAEKEQQTACDWAKKYSSALQVVDAQACCEIEPALLKNTGTGLWLPEVAQMRNPRLMKAMRQSMELNSYIDAFEGCQIVSIDKDKNGGCSCSSLNEKFNAAKVIVTSGAWSAGLLETTGVNLKVEPVLGQMILFKTRNFSLQKIILSKDRYVIPRKDGRVLVGSTLEHVGFNKKTTRVARDELVAEANRIIPGLADYPVEHHWAGLRPGSSKGIPYIAEHPEIKNLYVNTGHFRNGVVLGLASVKLLMDIIAKRDSVFNVSDYQISAK